MATPLASSTPSTSASSTSTGGVTIEAVIAQLQRMDARFDTLNTELYQLNTCVVILHDNMLVLVVSLSLLLLLQRLLRMARRW